MLISILLITLSFSFCLQILVIIQYLLTKGNNYYRIFLGTFVINTALMIFTTIRMFKYPTALIDINIKFILWLLSGFILIFILFIKITVLIKILKRTKDPNYYTTNFFGKKVYEKGLVAPKEFVTLIITMPFFLLVGSYFVARLINLILYRHL